MAGSDALTFPISGLLLRLDADVPVGHKSHPATSGYTSLHQKEPLPLMGKGLNGWTNRLPPKVGRFSRHSH